MNDLFIFFFEFMRIKSEYLYFTLIFDILLLICSPFLHCNFRVHFCVPLSYLYLIIFLIINVICIIIIIILYYIIINIMLSACHYLSVCSLIICIMIYKRNNVYKRIIAIQTSILLLF